MNFFHFLSLDSCATEEQHLLSSLDSANNDDDDDVENENLFKNSLNSNDNEYSCLLSTDSGMKRKFFTNEAEKSQCSTSNAGFGKRRIYQIPEINENQVNAFNENMLINSTNVDKNLINKEVYSYLKNYYRLKKKFSIEIKYELGNLTELFLNKHLSKLFFLSIISYLFGDLIIYNSMMAKSLRELAW